jgi:hypothetical protein
MVTREHFVQIARAYLEEFEHVCHTGNDQRTEQWINMLADVLENVYQQGYDAGVAEALEVNEQFKAISRHMKSVMPSFWEDQINGVCVYCNRKDCTSDHK